MAGNTFGTLFRITTFGESHGKGVGCIVDGCPPKIKLAESDIQAELSRRKPGQSKITTQRNESDTVEILSGVFEGKTTGTPIAMMVRNKDQKSDDYNYIEDKYRPGHADYVYDQKYGHRAWPGGGRASARETIARVAAGALAKKILKENFDIDVIGFVSRVKDISCDFEIEKIKRSEIESNIARCPNKDVAKKIINLIEQTKKQGDSVGGVITCIVKNAPIGLGEPVFDKLDAQLAHVLMSIPATKSFEIGNGLEATYLKGSENNDELHIDNNKTRTRTNRAGGMQGGISNGENIIINLGFKPTATINKKQKTVNNKGEEILIENIKGRHDPCVLPRAVPIVEAMVAIVLLDNVLIQKSRES